MNIERPFSPSPNSRLSPITLAHQIECFRTVEHWAMEQAFRSSTFEEREHWLTQMSLAAEAANGLEWARPMKSPKYPFSPRGAK